MSAGVEERRDGPVAPTGAAAASAARLPEGLEAHDAPPTSGAAAPRDGMLEAVARRQARKARSRREERPGLARGLGASGMIGWSIAVPTLVGVALGAWLDGRADAGFSWTLTLMAVGLLVGCANAWYWARRESQRD
ncbi:MAG TPA: AtpZ/AtpI family protein [Trueperaceae bacterium]